MQQTDKQAAQTAAMRKEEMYHVHFRHPPYGHTETDFYFRSLTAIYLVFTAKEIGCAVGRLYNVKVSQGKEYVSDTCYIRKQTLIGAKHESACLRGDNEYLDNLHRRRK